MSEKKVDFDDPLKDIDPVMEDAFSVNGEDSNLDQDSDFLDESSKKSSVDISDVEFPDIKNPYKGDPVGTDVFSNIPVNVSVELGRSVVSLKEIFEFTEGSIVELDRLVGEPLDLVVNGQIVAKGEVVAIDNNFGLRIKSIVSKTS